MLARAPRRPEQLLAGHAVVVAGQTRSAAPSSLASVCGHCASRARLQSGQSRNSPTVVGLDAFVHCLTALIAWWTSRAALRFPSLRFPSRVRLSGSQSRWLRRARLHWTGVRHAESRPVGHRTALRLRGARAFGERASARLMSRNAARASRSCMANIGYRAEGLSFIAIIFVHPSKGFQDTYSTTHPPAVRHLARPCLQKSDQEEIASAISHRPRP